MEYREIGRMILCQYSTQYCLFSFSDSTLTTLKRHLREKYLNDIDVIQRSTAGDPEAWTKLDQITQQIESLKKLLRDTEDLTILQNDQQQPLNEMPQVAAEICCPICFEEMKAPKQILCCTNGKCFMYTYINIVF